MKGLWFTELQTNNLAISCKVKRTLHREQTPYQELEVLDTETFGHMLVLDGAIQTTEQDEFIYHEMITLVALNSHPAPRRVLIIGGGDGGAAREAALHPRVESVTLAEIDERVPAVSRAFLPGIAAGLDHPKVNLRIGDGIAHVREVRAAYDVVIVDSTDPVGPAVGLFSGDFYRAVYEALADDGIMVAQTESPFYNKDLIRGVQQELAATYPIRGLYQAFVPTYPGGLWTFSVGSKRHDPQVPLEGAASRRYYSPEVHRAAFALPPFVQELLG